MLNRPKNKFRATVEEKANHYMGRTCPVCGKPLSSQRPVCFACPIYSLEYYEERERRNKEKRL
jgi:uncharacterized OB-fold protein